MQIGILSSNGKTRTIKIKPIGLMSPRIKKERRLIYEVVS